MSRRLPLAAAVGVVGAALLLTSCSSGESGEEASATPSQTVSASATSSPSPTCSPTDVIAEWPREAQVRQLLFAGIWTEGDSDPVGVATAVAAEGIGGLNFLGNNAGAYAEGELAAAREAAGDIEPFLAVDQEGGRVQRLRDVIGSQPSAREMGATMTPAEVQDLARETGEAMVGMELDMDLAPVLGVSDQPNDTVIGDRAFSNDPAEVTQYAGAYADGLREAGIIPVLKHFPGLGSATGNTDDEPASTPPLDELRAKDLIPYETLTTDEPVAVMMATAVVPGLTDGEQAGLSPAGVDLLRQEYGFDGVVMTDSLSGAAVTSDYTLPEAAVLALAAGNDMVLWDSTAEIDDLITAITAAIGDGTLPEAQIARSVARVLDLKGYDACAAQG